MDDSQFENLFWFANMLSIVRILFYFNFLKSEPLYAYKCYAYKKVHEMLQHKYYLIIVFTQFMIFVWIWSWKIVNLILKDGVQLIN